jgi:hypothetical protein
MGIVPGTDAGSEILLSAAYAGTKEIFTAETPRRRELSGNCSDLSIQSIVLNGARSGEFRRTFKDLSAPRRLCGEKFLPAKQKTRGYQ